MRYRRGLAGVAAALGVLAIGLGSVFGQANWPSQVITLTIPFAPGGPVEAPMRLVTTRMSELLGEQIIIENVGGAGGMVGAARVMRSAPDGYQMVYGNIGTHAQNQLLYKKPLYDAAADFAPISLVWTSLRVLVVRKDLPANNLKEFIALAREKGEALRFGASGAGGSTHVACLLLNTAMGAKTTHVPYRGTAPALQDLIAGRIDYICDSVQTALPFLKNGDLKALALLSPKRSLTVPDMPTADEQGLKGFDAGAWGALFYPRKTPEAIVQRVSKAVSNALDTPAVHDKIEAMGVAVTPPDERGPDYLGKFVRSEIEKWAGPIKASGVVVQ